MRRGIAILAMILLLPFQQPPSVHGRLCHSTSFCSPSSSRYVARLRGGFEKKSFYEGKLLGSLHNDTSWVVLKLVLTDDTLSCYQGAERNLTLETRVSLDEADFLPADSSTIALPANYSGNHSSMLEIQVKGGTSVFLLASSPEERNKWLLAMCTKSLAQKMSAPQRVESEQVPWVSQDQCWGGISMLLQGFACFGRQQKKERGISPPALELRHSEMNRVLVHDVRPTLDLAEATLVSNSSKAAGNQSLEAARALKESQHTEVKEEQNGTEVAEMNHKAVDEKDEQHLLQDLADCLGLHETGGDVQLETTIVEATEEHTATVIWLHSIGDSGGYENLPETLDMPWCRFVFPTAGTKPVTLHNGISEPSWFDITKIDEKGVAQDDADLKESTHQVMRLVEKEIAEKNIKPERIVLAGFGQGGVIALQCALQSKQRLAGVVALSTWFQPHESVRVNPEAEGLPVLICHGNADVFIPPKLGRLAKEWLHKEGLQTVFLTYDMIGHAFCPKEVEDVHKFMMQILPRNDSKPELPTWMEAVVKEQVRGMMGIKRWQTRSLVLSDGILQCYSLGQGALVASFDLTEYVVTATEETGAGYGIAIRQRELNFGEGEDGDPERFENTFMFGSERERDHWLLALVRWQQALLSRHKHSRIHSVGITKSRYFESSTDVGFLKWVGKSIGGMFGLGRSSSFITRQDSGIPHHLRKGPVWENLVFSGGGIKSVVHPAALGVIADCYGDEGRDLKWVKRVAGVSAGSLAAVLIACGCNIAQIQEAASKINVMKLQDGVTTIQGVRNMLQGFGVYDGKALAELVDDLIAKFTGMRYATFQDLYKHSGIFLKVFATSVRSGALQEFSVERTPHDQVAMACRCSMAVPFLFQAVATTEGDLLVDGGVLDNCPLDTFNEIPGVRNPKTLGFYIKMVDDGQPVAPPNLKAFALRMVELILYVEQYRAIEREAHNEIIWIPVPDIPLNTFVLSDEANRQLYECGTSAAARFLRPYQMWQRKMGTWPTAMALFKELESNFLESAKGDSKGKTNLMRWLSAASGRTSSQRYDKIRSFVRSWLTDRRRSTRLTRDILGPKMHTREANPSDKLGQEGGKKLKIEKSQSAVDMKLHNSSSTTDLQRKQLKTSPGE